MKLRDGHRDKYDAAMEQLQKWKQELFKYMDYNALRLVMIMAGPLGMDGPAVGAAIELPVVSPEILSRLPQTNVVGQYPRGLAQ